MHKDSAGYLTLQYKGSPFKIKVMPVVAEEYMKHMPEKPVVSD